MEKDLRVLVDNKLTMSEQHAAAASASGMLGKGIISRDPLRQHLIFMGFT